MSSHSLKTVAGLAIVFLIGAGQAFHSGFNATDIIEMLIAGLLALEHAIAGNTA